MKKLKKIIRKLLFVREKENISDAINRHKINVMKIIEKNVETIDKQTFLKNLQEMDIKNGDVLMVHASWRSLYKFDGNPEDIIEILLNLVGKEGTLLMPCFGEKLTYFDVKNTPSQAGVISETFRKMHNVVRSECSHFSVCGYGPHANLLLKKHKFSIFGFDHFSPYYLFLQNPNSKILHLGLGKYPIKTTLVHCVEYIYKDVYPYFNSYLSEKYSAIVIDQDGIKHEREMIRGTYAKLNKKNIVKLYKNIPAKHKKYKKIGNIDVRLISACAGFQVLKKMTQEGITMLKPPFKDKDSFKKINNNIIRG